MATLKEFQTQVLSYGKLEFLTFVTMSCTDMQSEETHEILDPEGLTELTKFDCNTVMIH